MIVAEPLELRDEFAGLGDECASKRGVPESDRQVPSTPTGSCSIVSAFAGKGTHLSSREGSQLQCRSCGIVWRSSTIETDSPRCPKCRKSATFVDRGNSSNFAGLVTPDVVSDSPITAALAALAIAAIVTLIVGGPVTLVAGRLPGVLIGSIAGILAGFMAARDGEAGPAAPFFVAALALGGCVGAGTWWAGGASDREPPVASVEEPEELSAAERQDVELLCEKYEAESERGAQARPFSELNSEALAEARGDWTSERPLRNAAKGECPEARQALLDANSQARRAETERTPPRPDSADSDSFMLLASWWGDLPPNQQQLLCAEIGAASNARALEVAGPFARAAGGQVSTTEVVAFIRTVC